jgi:hypothetical protein
MYRDATADGQWHGTRYIAAALIVGIISRFFGTFGDLWLDEVWSVTAALGASEWAHIFTQLRTDNNHLLTTLWIRLVGDTEWLPLYRALSFLCGIVSLWWVAQRYPFLWRSSRVVASIVFATSFLLVLYDSEARGYSGAVCATLIAATAFLREGSPATYWVASLFGIMSHLLFVQSLVAMMIAHGVAVLRRERGIRSWCLFHIPPMIGVSLLYFVFIRHLPPGSGPRRSYFIVILQSLAATVGAPDLSVHAPHTVGVTLVIALLGVYVLVSGLSAIGKQNPLRSVWYGAAIVIAPAIFLIAGPRVVFPRYFLIPIACFYLMSAEASVIYWRRGWASRTIVATLVMGAVLSNVWSVWRFLEVKRGSYASELELMDDHSQTVVTVSGDHDRRNGDMVRFYSSRIGKPIVYHNLDEVRVERPRYFLMHSQDRACVPPPFLVVDEIPYRFVRSTEFAGQSGWRWSVYIRTEEVRLSKMEDSRVCTTAPPIVAALRSEEESQRDGQRGDAPRDVG